MRFVSTVQKFLFTAIFLFSSASFAAQGEVNISSETQVDKTTEEVLEVFLHHLLQVFIPHHQIRIQITTTIIT